jgi:hypothetical protein
MATLVTFTAGTPILSADVNANFSAINTEVGDAPHIRYSSIVPVGNIGTGEDTLHTWSMPAGTITTAADGLLVRAIVTFGSGVETKALKFWIGSASHALNTAVPAPASLSASVDLYVIYVGSNQWYASSKMAYDNETWDINSAGLLTGQNPAGILTVKFTGEATTTDKVQMNASSIFVFTAP